MENILEDLLIEKCRRGEEDAFRELVKIYRRQLYSYLWRLTGDKMQAEDAFQETLIKVWKAIGKYDHRDRFSSWLFSIAHNAAMDSIRKNRARINLFQADEVEMHSSGSNPYSECVGNELKEIMEKIIGGLPEKQRQVFLLREHGGMSFKEISEATGEPLNTVLGHMHYAVEKIKRALRKKNAI
ncbi:MAG: RNA polymerase sigma factor [Bacteroidota bacterium]|jgi:RNA polymerase sigma-70 factor (ECF subfamily)|nr:sigma-70 family RNA polymerase sigma factor [Ignavibacteria bacterium]MCU7500204.1 sigma-70 family RNA polymerase sigma factor [Ignavibacteria bacterium]MCU7513864.1 sigma-70 family RNA polymerase sigma factor [Ignavibacteria bacterium]MCU7521546.1 sigma-70 family RNA polymerase sigma factor [Ignavibacteria bacterium]MCU7525000.1 sigma-70 family RNA polymerase sigma factor [Ignavibacteria bacterium]